MRGTSDQPPSLRAMEHPATRDADGNLSGLAPKPAPPRGHAVALDSGPPVPQLDQPGFNHLQAVEEPQDLGMSAVGVLLVADAVNAVPRFSQLGLEV